MLVTDSATTQETVNSIKTPTITITGTPITVTTISSGGGGGVHGSGGSGVPPPLPVVTQSQNSTTVSDLAPLGTVTLQLQNRTLQVTETELTPNYTILSINGEHYTLYPNTTVPINNSLIYIQLNKLNFPTGGRHTVSLAFSVAGQPSPTELFEIGYIPSYSSAATGQKVMMQVAVQNIWTGAEHLTLNSPSSFLGNLSFSANNLTINPGESVTTNLQFKPSSSVGYGLYILPISIVSMTSAGINSKETQYISIDIINKSSTKPYTATQINLINNSQTASGVIQVFNPKNATLTNTSLVTVIPAGVVSNISSINAYGLQNNVTFVNGTYVIDWYLGYVSSRQPSYAYFTLDHPSSIPRLAFIQNKLVPIASRPQQHTISISNLYLPTLYTNSTGRISIYAVYTNATPQKVTFSLNAPPGITIVNSTRSINATLNESINETFQVITGPDSGTFLLNLRADAPGGSVNQTVPVFVIPKPVFTVTIPSTVTNLPPVSTGNIETVIGVVAAAAIIGYAISKNPEQVTQGRTGFFTQEHKGPDK